MNNIIFIIYVSKQEESRKFYEKILNQKPVLDVPGMTEFQINEHTKLGLMPEKGIAKILKDKTPNPESGNGIPRCELYIYTDNPEENIELAIKSGAKEISKYQSRDWGDYAGYVSDPDGHIVAFAKKIAK